MSAPSPGQLLDQALDLLWRNPRRLEVAQLVYNLSSSPQVPPSDQVRALQALSDMDPENLSLQHDLACALMRAGQPDKALKALMECREQDPSSLPIRKNLIVCLLELGRFQDAFERMCELNKDIPGEAADFGYLIGMAELLCKGGPRKKRFEIAAQAFCHHLAYQPQSVPALIWAVQCHLFANNPAGAEAVLSARQFELLSEEDRPVFQSLQNALNWWKQVNAGDFGCPDMTGEGERYVLPFAVWGKDYIDALEEFGLPGFLSKGNLPEMAKRGEVHVLIMTVENDLARVEALPLLDEVRRYATCSVLCLPELIRQSSYRLMSLMHWTSVRYAKAQKAHLFSGSPDIVVFEDFLASLDDHRRRGAEVVFVDAFLGEPAPVMQWCRQKVSDTGQMLTVSPQEGALLASNYPWSQLQLALTENNRNRIRQDYPAVWPLSSGGYVQICSRSSPSLVSWQALARFDGSLFLAHDTDFLEKILGSEEYRSRCVVLGSHESGTIELSRALSPNQPLITPEKAAKAIGVLGTILLQPQWVSPLPMDPTDPAWLKAQEFRRIMVGSITDNAAQDSPPWAQLWQDQPTEECAAI